MDNFYILEKENARAGILKGKSNNYDIYGPIDLIDKILEIGKSGIQINRYKGLGEMNPDQLWETTLDRNERSLLMVKINEIDQANKIFDDLMGDNVAPRKTFIEENVHFAVNIDI